MGGPSKSTSEPELNPKQREAFDALVLEWAEHVELTLDDSDPETPLLCDAFTNLAAMGATIVPEIFARYTEQSPVPWGALLARITGHMAFGIGTVGDLPAIRRQWFAWGQQEGLS